jgi:hypothetical protein
MGVRKQRQIHTKFGSSAFLTRSFKILKVKVALYALNFYFIVID